MRQLGDEKKHCSTTAFKCKIEASLDVAETEAVSRQDRSLSLWHAELYQLRGTAYATWQVMQHKQSRSLVPVW